MMRSRALGALAVFLCGSAGCDSVLGADFDDLVLAEDSGASANVSGAGGASAGGSTADGGMLIGSTGGGGGIGPAGAGGLSSGGSAGTTGGTAGMGAVGGMGTGGMGSGGTAGGMDASAGTGGTGGGGGIVDGVVINEARNSSGDFIELYNTDGVEFDLSGYGLTDEASAGSPDVGGAERFPAGTIVPPYGFVLVLANMPIPDGPTNNCTGLPAPCYHVTFGVNQGGETAFLLTPSDDVKDSTLVPGNLTSSTTWGRYPDGTGGFDYVLATPKSPNMIP
jgi:hypothetical protein